MMKERRHAMILELLNSNDVIKVSELVNELDVTEMTIRRDLQELEDNHQLIRIHGGARRVVNDSTYLVELDHRLKREINLEEKKEIAPIIANNIH